MTHEHQNLLRLYHELAVQHLTQLEKHKDYSVFHKGALGWPAMVIADDTLGGEPDTLAYIAGKMRSGVYPETFLLPPTCDIDAITPKLNALGFTMSAFWTGMELLPENYAPKHLSYSNYRVKSPENEVEVHAALDVIHHVLFPRRSLGEGQRLFELPNLRWHVVEATDTGKLIATTMSYLDRDTDVCGVFMVAVEAEYRGLGLGRTMIEHAVDAAFAEGYRYVTLQSTDMARKLYRRLGYKPVGFYGLFRLSEGE